MRFFLISFILLLAMTAQGISVQSTLPKAPPGDAVNLVGRWRVKFSLMGGNEKNLVFEARGKGEGSFLLLDTGLDDKPVVSMSMNSKSLSCAPRSGRRTRNTSRSRASRSPRSACPRMRWAAITTISCPFRTIVWAF